MIQLVKADASHKDFIALVAQLDADLAEKNGEEHSFYHQYNQLDHIKFVVLLYESKAAVACGAIKKFDDRTMEIKRMYTIPNKRGKGYAKLILKVLEEWVRDMAYQKCILETGIKQKEALRLYQQMDYKVIPNYGQYKGVAGSFCFEKQFE